MYCPECGQKTNLEQIYCRSCGAELGETSHKLSTYYADLDEKTDWIKRAGFFSIGVVFSAVPVFLFFLAAAVIKLNPGVTIILFPILTIILTAMISVLYLEKKHSQKVKKELIKDKNFAPLLPEAGKSNRKLNESSFQSMGSVTENSTELFTAKIPKTQTSGELR